MAPICHNILTIYIDLVSYVWKRQKKISKKLVGNNQEVQHETGDIHLDIFLIGNNTEKYIFCASLFSHQSPNWVWTHDDGEKRKWQVWQKRDEGSMWNFTSLIFTQKRSCKLWWWWEMYQELMQNPITETSYWKSFKRSACPCKTRLAWQLKKLWSIATLRVENKKWAKVSFPRASWYFNKL